MGKYQELQKLAATLRTERQAELNRRGKLARDGNEWLNRKLSDLLVIPPPRSFAFDSGPPPVAPSATQHLEEPTSNDDGSYGSSASLSVGDEEQPVVVDFAYRSVEGEFCWALGDMAVPISESTSGLFAQRILKAFESEIRKRHPSLV
jgi:hypothetical protein